MLTICFSYISDGNFFYLSEGKQPTGYFLLILSTDLTKGKGRRSCYIFQVTHFRHWIVVCFKFPHLVP